MLRLPPMIGTSLLVAGTACLAVTGEAQGVASPVTQTEPVNRLVCAERAERPSQAPGQVRPNDELMGNETFQRVMTDALRLKIVAGFCELRQDTLALDLGPGAATAASADYNLSRVYAAYRGLTEYRPETALELRYEDRLVGWYTAGGLSWIEKPTPQPPPVLVERTGDSGPDEEPRRGLHFSAGLGGGSFDQQCRGCEIESELGLSGVLSLGGWLGRETVLGVEGTGWTKEVAGHRTQVYSVMAQVTRFASATSGLFLGVGAGLVGFRDDSEFTAAGPGFSGRVGYELGLGKIHVGPYLGYLRSFDGTDLKRDGDEVGFNFVISQLQLGLGVSVY